MAPTSSPVEHVSTNHLREAGVGILRFLLDKTADPRVMHYSIAVADLRAQGAEIVDPVPIPEFDASNPALAAYRKGESLAWSDCSPFKFELNDYFASLGSVGDYVRKAAEVHVELPLRSIVRTTRLTC